MVGKQPDSCIFYCAAQLCRRHRAKRGNQCNGDLASRRLRAYDRDRLDGSVLWSWVYTYTHANSDSHSYLHAQTDTNREASALDETSANSAATPVTDDDRLVERVAPYQP